MSPRLAVHRFGPDDRAPGAARRFAGVTLGEWGLAPLCETVELLVSEVVTNAVGHAQSGGEMVMTFLPAGLRVEVSDRGAGEVAPRVAGPEDVTGRGMAIVTALAARWGVHGEDPDTGWYKTVWFEVDAEPAARRSISVTSHGTL
jgi:anti-sigma regulatory factor (Ser/Thr protein kinase)